MPTKKIAPCAYAVQAFCERGKRLDAEKPQPARDEAHALRMAEHLAESRAGVLAFRVDLDPDSGEPLEHTILARHGRLPDGLDLPF